MYLLYVVSVLLTVMMTHFLGLYQFTYLLYDYYTTSLGLTLLLVVTLYLTLIVFHFVIILAISYDNIYVTLKLTIFILTNALFDT